MQMLKVVLVSAITLTTGIAVGWVLRDTHGGAAPAPATWHVSAAAPQGEALSTTTFDAAELRAVVRAELKAALANGSGAASATPPTVDVTPPTPELVAKRQAAVAEIEGMIKGGEWGNEQRMNFQQRIGMLAPEQGARVLHDVTVALNEGRLHVTTVGPPL